MTERMEKIDPNDLLSRLGKLGGTAAEKARALLDEICDDGIASRREAEAIFVINRQLEEVFPDWDPQFCILLKDFLLTGDEPIGWIDIDKLNWLAQQIAPHAAKAKRNEFDLLISVLPFIETISGPFSECALEVLTSLASQSGRMTGELVEGLRSILLHTIDATSPWISQKEARCLLELNDRLGFARNDDLWNRLYARAMANHLVAMAHPAPENVLPALDRKTWLNTDTEAELGGAYLLGIQSEDDGTWFERVSPSLTRASRAHSQARAHAANPVNAPRQDGDWLVRRLGWNDQSVTLADWTLIDFFNTHAPGFAQGITLAARPDQAVSEMAFS